MKPPISLTYFCMSTSGVEFLWLVLFFFFFFLWVTSGFVQTGVRYWSQSEHKSSLKEILCLHVPKKNSGSQELDLSTSASEANMSGFPQDALYSMSLLTLWTYITYCEDNRQLARVTSGKKGGNFAEMGVQYPPHTPGGSLHKNQASGQSSAPSSARI